MAHKIQRYGWVPDLPDLRDQLYSAPVAALQAMQPAMDLTSTVSAGLRPGPVGQLHRQRHRRRPSSSSCSNRSCPISCPPGCSSTTMSAHGGHRRLGQRRADSRWHQVRGQTGRVPRTRVALRHCPVQDQAAQALLRRGAQTQGDRCISASRRRSTRSKAASPRAIRLCLASPSMTASRSPAVRKVRPCADARHRERR